MDKGYRVVDIGHILDLLKEYDISSIPVSDDEEAEIVSKFCAFVVRHHAKIKKDETDTVLAKIGQKLKNGALIKDVLYEAFNYGKESK